jgi:hypothetical protein
MNDSNGAMYFQIARHHVMMAWRELLPDRRARGADFEFDPVPELRAEAEDMDTVDALDPGALA